MACEWKSCEGYIQYSLFGEDGVEMTAKKENSQLYGGWAMK